MIYGPTSKKPVERQRKNDI